MKHLHGGLRNLSKSEQSLRKAFIIELGGKFDEMLAHRPTDPFWASHWDYLTSAGLQGLGVYGSSTFLLRQGAEKYARNSGDLDTFCAYGDVDTFNPHLAFEAITDALKALAERELNASLVHLVTEDVATHFDHRLHKRLLRISRVFQPSHVENILMDADRYRLTPHEQYILRCLPKHPIRIHLKVSVKNILYRSDVLERQGVEIRPDEIGFRGLVFQSYAEAAACKIGKINIVPETVKATDYIDLHALLSLAGLVERPKEARRIFHRRFYREDSPHQIFLRERYAQKRYLSKEATFTPQTIPNIPVTVANGRGPDISDAVRNLLGENRLIKYMDPKEIKRLIHQINEVMRYVLQNHEPVEAGQ